MQFNKRQAPDLYSPYATEANPAYFEKMHDVEWRGQLQSATGGRKFRIKYYGDLYTWEVKQQEAHQEMHRRNYGNNFNGLIVETNEAPELIYAVDVATGEEILLFDYCAHGYDNLFNNEWDLHKMPHRNAENIYKDAAGNEIFEVVVRTYNNIDYEDKDEGFVQENGLIKLMDGREVDIPYMQRNGFDAIAIVLYAENGDMVVVHQRELA
ncbi:hypothetical protein CLV59_1061 [Chitinophaga dinghuensis]|uniref:Uncharacterized protein n=1 Tax=Chitinophaga dinghuensis TaxID=1539050 RepID=A0A327VTY7_9BACT|nr:hypothetical protein [Chitinophaga dinghuensis]RAJ78942.1 hypothetical protein CLV59_1061 [Chitinophaga dinghuensis]